MAMKLVLFDIDGTLLHCGGKTREPLAEALEQVCGTSGSLRTDGFAGKTDDQIVFDALISAGLDEGEITEALPQIKSRYLGILEERVDGEGIRLLPGVLETLERLAADDSVRVGLLTGNWRTGAHWKLQHFDLNGQFEVGAFGDGRRDRIELPPVALGEARARFGFDFPVADVVIVGDTPNDVRCGHHHGIPVLAVATGYSARRELQESGADWVCDNLIEAGCLEPVLSEIDEDSSQARSGGGAR